ncbi:MAG: tRNA pseudouridine(55) synthase TruB [Sphingomonas sp.]
MHGWIILDKPLGLGSTQAVAAVKRALRDGGYGKFKVGHGGTLDPLATGVLPIAIGEATKLAGRMLDATKAYEFTIAFGTETDTLDAEGKVVATAPHRPRPSALRAILGDFTGPISQLPPLYSALKVGGERAYDLARAGKDVVLAPRDVTVLQLAIRHPMPDTGDPPVDSAVLFAHVSKGTYIRSLARDIALALGTVGHVTMLRRTSAGPFGLDDAISLDKLAELGHAHGLEDKLLPLRAALDDIPAFSLTPGQAELLRNGQMVIGTAVNDGLCFAMLGDVPIALAKAEAGEIRVVRGFNL